MQATSPIAAKLAEFRGGQIVCLHILGQPLVNDAQAVVRHLDTQMLEAAQCLQYVLRRIANDARAGDVFGVGTESFSRLTQAEAVLTGKDVDIVREYWIPGSAAIHRTTPKK